MTDIILITYMDTNDSEETIEGFVDTEEDFYLWLIEHNKKRVAEGNEAESKSSFKLTEVIKLVEEVNKMTKIDKEMDKLKSKFSLILNLSVIPLILIAIIGSKYWCDFVERISEVGVGLKQATGVIFLVGIVPLLTYVIITTIYDIKVKELEANENEAKEEVK